MKKLAFLLIITSILISQSALASSEKAEYISVKAEVDKALITIGERAAYTVTVRHDPSIRLASTIRFPNTRDFEIKGVQDIESVTGEDGLITEGRKFIITTYTLGEYIIEPASAHYITPENVTKEIKTERIFITVESIDAADKEKTDIRTIKGIVEIPNRLLLIMIVLLLAAVIGSVVIFLIRRGQLATKSTEGKKALLPPAEEAYEALRQLFDSDLLKNKQFKTYYFRLSEIIRRYLERRFTVNAIEMTTLEILSNLKAIRFDEVIRKKIGSLLANCDLVKFAKYIPDTSEIENDQKLAREIVDLTKPKEEPQIQGTEKTHPAS